MVTPYVIAEEFCAGCGESIGYDVRPLTLYCAACAPPESADPEVQS